MPDKSLYQYGTMLWKFIVLKDFSDKILFTVCVALVVFLCRAVTFDLA